MGAERRNSKRMSIGLGQSAKVITGETPKGKEACRLSGDGFVVCDTFLSYFDCGALYLGYVSIVTACLILKSSPTI